MNRVEITTDAGGHLAMLLSDSLDVSSAYAMAIRLASEVRVPATVRIIPIPPDVTGRMALYWFPERTRTKETNGNPTEVATGGSDIGDVDTDTTRGVELGHTG